MIKLELLQNNKFILDDVKNIKNFNLSLDSRTLKDGDAFLALKGENYNALDFLDQIISKNCKLIFYEKNNYNDQKVIDAKNKNSNIQFIAVSDSLKFFQNLMHDYLSYWKGNGGKVIVISGSNGKTTTKEMIGHILTTSFPGKVIKTEKNNNNHIGVPLTINQLNEGHKFLVLELGSNHPGEMDELCKIIEPELGFITNIGETHLEFFGNLESVFNEETKCVEYINNKKGVVIVNTDDILLSNIRAKNILKIGSGSNNDFVFEYQNGFNILNKNKKLNVNNKNITGIHNHYNLFCALVCSSVLSGNNIEEMIQIAESFMPRDNRSMWINYNNKKIYLDAYNANPSSMISSLSSFKEYLEKNNIPKERALLVLGDMNELGNYTEVGHKKVSDFVNKNGFKASRFIGRYTHFYLEQNRINDAKCYLTALEYKTSNFISDLDKFDYFFIKASRSLKLESLIDIK